MGREEFERRAKELIESDADVLMAVGLGGEGGSVRMTLDGQYTAMGAPQCVGLLIRTISDQTGLDPEAVAYHASEYAESFDDSVRFNPGGLE